MVKNGKPLSKVREDIATLIHETLYDVVSDPADEIFNVQIEIEGSVQDLAKGGIVDGRLVGSSGILYICNSYIFGCCGMDSKRVQKINYSFLKKLQINYSFAGF